MVDFFDGIMANPVLPSTLIPTYTHPFSPEQAETIKDNFFKLKAEGFSNVTLQDQKDTIIPYHIINRVEAFNFQSEKEKLKLQLREEKDKDRIEQKAIKEAEKARIREEKERLREEKRQAKLEEKAGKQNRVGRVKEGFDSLSGAAEKPAKALSKFTKKYVDGEIKRILIKASKGEQLTQDESDFLSKYSANEGDL